MEVKKKRYPKGPQVKVDVTEEIIRRSVAAHSSHCMIAEGVKVAAPWATGISVDIQCIRFSDPKKRLRYIYLTPRIAQVPLIKFDQGILPEPFSIILRGAQVTSMGQTRPNKASPDGPGKSPALKKAEEVKNLLAKQQLIERSSTGGQRHTRVGGKPPPRSAFANRRGFGVRLLGRPPVVTTTTASAPAEEA